MTMTTRMVRVALFAAVVAVATPALAQQPAKKGAAPAAPAAPAPSGNTSPKKVDLPTPPPNFEYASQGRRDPFVDLLARGDDGKTSKSDTHKVRAEGVPGIMTGELFVRGIMQTRGGFIAMVAGADKKIYTVRNGDKLADGVIRQITANSIVILQEVNDPLSLEKQREVRKFLRGGDEVK